MVGATRPVSRDLRVSVRISDASCGWWSRLPSVHSVATAASFSCRHQQQTKGTRSLSTQVCSVQSPHLSLARHFPLAIRRGSMENVSCPWGAEGQL